MRKNFLAVILFILSIPICFAQDLEPRSLTNVPTGLNFALAAYGYSQGNILLDPAVPIEDLDAQLNTFIGAYVRSFSFFGMASKIDAVLPYAFGHWDGNYNGVDTSTSRSGFGDARIRLSVNFIGSPALSLEEFSTYKQKTIVGANIQIIAPTGQYYKEKLINLGSNRWTIKPQVGVSHRMNTWYIEGYVGAWIYRDNNQFLTDNTLNQKPFFTFKSHVIKSFNKGKWAALDFGYGYGAKTYINGIAKETLISSFKFGATYAMPLSQKQSLKINVSKAIRIKRGPDFIAFSVAYQYRWMK